MSPLAKVISLDVARDRRDEPWITKAELARHLSLSTRTIERWVVHGLPHSEPFTGSHPRFRRSDCEVWIQQRHARRSAAGLRT